MSLDNKKPGSDIENIQHEDNVGAKIVVAHTDVFIQRIAYNASSQPQYIGLAKPGTASSAAGWQIKRLSYSGTNVTVIEFADGDTKFDNVWDNRAALSYS